MNESVVRSLSARHKAIILVSCCLSLLIVSMDATIVNVAIPSIRREFGASGSQIQWVVDIYTLVLASLLLLSGAAGDRFGRRRTFQIGLTVFALGSLLCSLAPNIETHIEKHRLYAASHPVTPAIPWTGRRRNDPPSHAAAGRLHAQSRQRER